MRSVSRHQATPEYVRRSQRLLRLTKGLPAIAGPFGEFEAALSSLQSRYDQWTQARIAASAALRVQHEVEGDLDLELRGVGMVILAAGQGHREDQVYRRYFPNGYGATLHCSARKSLEISAGLIAAMNDEINRDILDRRDRLTAARAKLVDATSTCQAAADARGQARAILEEEKLSFRSALDKFYLAVRTAFPDRRNYVESIFGWSDRRQPATEPVPPAAGEPAQGTPAAPVPSSPGLPDPTPPEPVPVQQQNATAAVNTVAT